MKLKRRDFTQIAFDVMRQATGEIPKIVRVKSQEATELGRLGGIKGGKARSKSLTPKRRIEIAKKAAAARWKDKKG